MKCARLQLQERLKPRVRETHVSSDRVRHYCQRKMVDPNHEEDPRWTGGVLQRFHCNTPNEKTESYDHTTHCLANQEPCDNLFLSVQTLKFQGDVQENNRPRTSFKYKTQVKGNKHRMFVKQTVEDQENNDVDTTSQTSIYYFDDYIKYILKSEQSRRSSCVSSCNRPDPNEQKISSQVPFKKNNTKFMKGDPIQNNTLKNGPSKNNEEKITGNNIITMDDAKISYHKSGKRKSLTISRVPSPETIQVIRVDVVCNYSSATSTISDCEENTKQLKSYNTAEANGHQVDLRNNHFANKYLLTKTIKTLDENVSGGAKVTLCCKTFRLSNRTTTPNNVVKTLQRPKTRTMSSLKKFNV